MAQKLLIKCTGGKNWQLNFTSSCVQVDLDKLICVDVFIFQPESAECLLDHLKQFDQALGGRHREKGRGQEGEKERGRREKEKLRSGGKTRKVMGRT